MPASTPPQLVVLDTETTGLDAQRDRVIDIGAVRLGPDLAVCDRFVTLVDPGVPIPLFITRLVGIADADVRDAPAFPAAFASLREFAGDAVLVGHNAGFDRDHLAAGARRAGLPPLTNPWFDTLEAALLLYPELDRHALTILAAEFGIARQAHRALPDAETAADVVKRLCARAAGRPMPPTRPAPKGRGQCRPRWRSASRQSILPVVTALRPSATLRLSSCVRSSRSASLDEASLITAANLSTMV